MFKTSTRTTGGGRLRIPAAAWKAMPLVSIVAILMFWEFGLRLSNIPSYIVPTPLEFLGTLLENRASISRHALATLEVIFVGFFVGSAIAIPMGLAIGLFPALERSLYYVIVILNTMPKVALAPLLVVWFGHGLTSKVILVAIGAFIPVFVDSIAGFKYLDPRFTYLTRSAGAHPLQTFLYVRFPSALPHLMAGLRTSLLIAIVLAIVVEYISAQVGLGYAAMRGVLNDDVRLVFAIVAVGTVIGFASNTIMDVIERLLLPWKDRRN